MFELIENDFTNTGICRYKDEYGNHAFMKRKDKGFVAKLRFNNAKIKATPMNIVLGDDQKEGEYLHLDYDSTVNLEDIDIKTGLEGFTELTQKWINMLLDIAYYGTNNQFIKKATGLEEDDIYSRKLEMISVYEELKPTISSIMGV